MPPKRDVLTVYGLASCDSCRKARQWLDKRGVPQRFHDVRADGLEVQTLERWASRIDWKKLLNTNSLTWRRLPEVDRSDLTWDRAVSLMLDHPTLVKRPILEHRRFIAVGYSPEQYEKIFEKL
jgi:arsenate reductase